MRSLLTVLALPLFLLACDSSVDEQLQGSPTGGFEALFDPGNAVIPFPSNLLFSGSTDGTLNIPLSGADSDAPRIAMNTLDGFSTVAPMTTSFSLAIDAATVTPAAVRVFSATADPATTAIISIDTELTFGVDFIASVSSVDTTGQTLAILPLKPLDAKSTYVVVITNSLKSTDGQSAIASQTFNSALIPNPVWDGTKSLFASFDDATAERLEPLRQLTAAQAAALETFEAGISATVALAWNFKTQSVSDVLVVARSLAAGVSAINSTSIGNTNQLNPGLFGKADVYVGGMTIPYYLGVPGTANPIAPLTDFWLSATAAPSPPFAVTTDKFLTQFNPIPNKTTDVTVPLLVSIPNASSVGGGAKPGTGWPVVLFQHGITGDRTNMLAIADAFADAGFATVAIDMPLHGLSPDSPLHDSVNGERTFGVDYVTQDANGSIIASAPDGTTDSSGRHFINLSSMLTSRDNIRQAVTDLFALVKALDTMDYDTGGADFDTTRIHFIGHSLGAIVGGVFLALETNVLSSVLAMPGGGIAKLLDGSATFGPEIAAGLLAQAGLSKGTSDFEAFFGAVQTTVDSADPINYASSANPVFTGKDRGILMFEVVGSDGSLPDQVVPNHVGTLANLFQDAPVGTVPGPLSGTDPLAAEMGLIQISDLGVTTGTNLQHLIRFSAGDHSSILSPAASLAVTVEMQTEAATFLATDGGTTLISDGTVIAPVP